MWNTKLVMGPCVSCNGLWSSQDCSAVTPDFTEGYYHDELVRPASSQLCLAFN